MKKGEFQEQFKIPEYDGIQTSLMKNTNNTMGRLSNNGTLNLDALNSKQDNRLDKIQNEVEALIQK